jgi:ATP-dependent RNA helicase DDX52/ROK1
VKQWLLDALPDVGKRDRQQLKKRGVEARRTAKTDDTKRSKDRISTKSGYERRVENNRRGAKEASKRREKEDLLVIESADESAFEGLEE